MYYMSIEIFDQAAEQLLDQNAEIICLEKGFQFTEGPVWDRAHHRLFFSDIPANTMYTYSASDGVQPYRKPSNFSNGLTIDRDGRLLACEHRTRRVTRTDAQGHVEVLATHYQGKRLNSPNDLIVASDDAVIFTDPHYGLEEGLGGPAEQEQPHRGVYRLIPGQDPVLLTDILDAPNGLALSPDERILYVDDSIHQHIRAFRVHNDWTLSGGDVLVELKPRDGQEGNPDGMKLDADGHIFCTGPDGVWVLNANGAILAHVHMPEVTANLNWGDDDARTLYLTASTGLYKLRTLTHG
jgi:gluconolactonase